MTSAISLEMFIQNELAGAIQINRAAGNDIQYLGKLVIPDGRR